GRRPPPPPSPIRGRNRERWERRAEESRGLEGAEGGEANQRPPRSLTSPLPTQAASDTTHKGPGACPSLRGLAHREGSEVHARASAGPPNGEGPEAHPRASAGPRVPDDACSPVAVPKRHPTRSSHRSRAAPAIRPA